MTAAEGSISGGHRAGKGTAWIVLGLLVALFCMVQDGAAIWRNLTRNHGSGIIAPTAVPTTLGGVSDPGGALVPAADKGPGLNVVSGLVPGSPLYDTGVRDGDVVRFDYPYDAARAIAAGENLGLTVDHGGQTRHVTVTAVQTPWFASQAVNDAGEDILDLILLSSVLTGVFILLRSQGRASFLLLGAAFICFGNRGTNPEYALSSLVFPYVSALCVVTLRVMPPLFLAFAVAFHEETTGRKQPWMRWLAGLFGAVMVVAGCAYSYATQAIVNLPVIGTGVKLYVLLYFLNLAFIAAIFIQGLRQADQPTRRRYVLMLIAIAMVMLARGVSWIGVLFETANFHSYFLLEFDNPLEVTTSILAFLGPLLFAYAALRNKVLDLGFAVNRTLVYGVLSFAILLVFGLVEWGAEKLLPERFFAGYSAVIKMLVEAGIALSVFLVFHRVRDFVEKLVESVFFRAWHHNEAQLKRFVAQASFFTQGAPLMAAFVAELKRFSGGADCALYEQDGAGFVRTGGSLKGAPKRLDGNDPLMVEARAERRRLDLDGAHSGLPGVLALPMIHRAEVSGLVLLGAKPSGDDYRPDEKDLLAWAAHQIGLDLHALQVEALQARIADLSGEVKTLRSVVTPAKSS